LKKRGIFVYGFEPSRLEERGEVEGFKGAAKEVGDRN